MKVNDCRLFFDVVGSGLVVEGPMMREKPTLLLLHGGPGLDHSGFRPAFDCLSDIAQVVVLDHRGNGRSESGSPEQWNLAQWAVDIKGFCDALGIVKPIVFGHSFGAMVAMSYAIRYPSHASKLILAATFATFNLEQFVSRFADVGGDRVRDAAQEFWSRPTLESAQTWSLLGMPYYSQTPPDPDEMARMQMSPEVMMHFIGGEAHEFNLLPSLKTVVAPTLLIGSGKDPVSSMTDMIKISDALVNAVVRLECLRNASHFLWRDEPEGFFDLVRKFVLEEEFSSAD